MGKDAIRVVGLGAYLPEHVMTNEEWSNYVDTSDEWITTRTGIKRRRIAAPDETTTDMAVAAASAALEDAGVSGQEIDEVIVATDTPEVFLPDTSSFVQHRLGIREVPAYEIGSSGCAGFIQALDIARARVHFGGGRILVVGVELLSRFMNWKDRNTCVLFGDAAAAAVVASAGEGGEILSAVAGTDGSQTGILTLEVGGTRKPFTLQAAQQGSHQNVVMNGREIFREAVRRMSEASLKVISDAKLTKNEIALVVPHQANLRIIEAVAKRLELPLEKFYINIQEYGNTGSASVPLALWEARGLGRISAGDIVLLTAFGAGFHWAAMLLKF